MTEAEQQEVDERKKKEEEEERKREERKQKVREKKIKEYADVATLKNTYSIPGKLLEETENILRFTYLPLMILSFAFAFTPVLGIVFPALLVFNFTISKVISNSFKDDLKDEGDKISKGENLIEATEMVDLYEQIPVLQQELDNLREQNASKASSKVQETLAKSIPPQPNNKSAENEIGN